MSAIATITDDCLSPPEYSATGATISEYDYLPIGSGFRSSRLRSNSNWLSEVLDEIDRLADLCVGWDSYGADPPDTDIVAAARGLIQDVANSYAGLPSPTIVTATRSGGIQFEWSFPSGAHFELEFASPTCIEYLFVDRSQGIEDEGSTIIRHDFDFASEVANRILTATQGR